jgi:hypothetical protein
MICFWQWIECEEEELMAAYKSTESLNADATYQVLTDFWDSSFFPWIANTR